LFGDFVEIPDRVPDIRTRLTFESAKQPQTKRIPADDFVEAAVAKQLPAALMLDAFCILLCFVLCVSI
jgi:hypothetical protein